MKIGKIDNVELSGLIVLFVGVILLAITFFSAYSFLAGELSTIAGNDILQAFGEVLAPLIGAVIRILFLGIMGWVGSLLTIRGVQLLKKEKTQTASPQQQSVKTGSNPASKQESKPEAKEEKTKTPESPKPVEKPEATAQSPLLPTPAPQ